MCEPNTLTTCLSVASRGAQRKALHDLYQQAMVMGSGWTPRSNSEYTLLTALLWKKLVQPLRPGGGAYRLTPHGADVFAREWQMEAGSWR